MNCFMERHSTCPAVVRARGTRRHLWLLLLLLLPLGLSAQSIFFDRLADSALTLTYQQVLYDPSYFSMDYPNGDVPAGRGVCTDVVIRAYRKLGIDLQQEVHLNKTFKL